MKLKYGKYALWSGIALLLTLRVLQYIFVIDDSGFFIRETLWQSILSDALYWVMGLWAAIAFTFRFCKAEHRPATPKQFASLPAAILSGVCALTLAVYGVMTAVSGGWLGYVALAAALYFALLPLRMYGNGGIVSFLSVFALAYPSAAAIAMFFANFREINASETVVDTVGRCASILMVLSLTKVFLKFEERASHVGRNFYLYALLGTLSGPGKLFGMLYTGNYEMIALLETVADIALWLLAIYLYHRCADDAMKGEKTMKQLIYAHRGASADYPENTMLAFRKAVEQGADGIELDVQFTKDHKIVVCHDDTIDRTSDGKGYVEDYTYEELLAFDFGRFKGEQFAGEKIPLLSQVLDLVKSSGILLNIEIKNRGEKVDGLEEAVSNMVNEYELNDVVIYSSFDHQMLYRLKAYDPTAKVAALYSHTPYNAFEYMQGLQVFAIHPAYKCVHSQEMCKKALQAGWQVNVWTVDTVEIAAPLAEAGITSFITNRPAFLREELTK